MKYLCGKVATKSSLKSFFKIEKNNSSNSMECIEWLKAINKSIEKNKLDAIALLLGEPEIYYLVYDGDFVKGYTKEDFKKKYVIV